jgi:hypothetical protein
MMMMVDSNNDDDNRYCCTHLHHTADLYDCLVVYQLIQYLLYIQWTYPLGSDSVVKKDRFEEMINKRL